MENQNNKPIQGNKQKKGGHMMKHGFMMMLCCLIPILLIAGLPLFGFRAGALSSLAVLLCPLMHVGMMVFMFRKKKDNSYCHSSEES